VINWFSLRWGRVRRVCGPLANSLFHYQPDETLKPDTKIEAAYYKADRAIQQGLDLLAA
jgi:hypothetical protein